MDFAAMIREARVRTGLSQSALARLLVTAKRPEGVWSTYIGQIEKGEKLPSEEICLKLADVLDLDPVTLLLSCYKARADTGPARAFLEEVHWAVGQLSASSWLSGADAPEDALMEDSILGMLDDGEWGGIVAGVCRQGWITELPYFLDMARELGASEWEALQLLMRATGGAPRRDH